MRGNTITLVHLLFRPLKHMVIAICFKNIFVLHFRKRVLVIKGIICSESVFMDQVGMGCTSTMCDVQLHCQLIRIIVTVEFFTVCTKLAEMAILYSKDLTTAKKKLPPVELNLMPQIITGLVQCLTR